jgi:hypothetical protein
VRVGGTLKPTLFIANDKDFLGTVTDTTHPDGIDNPKRFFVFAIDPDVRPATSRNAFPARTGAMDGRAASAAMITITATATIRDAVLPRACPQFRWTSV